MKSTTVKKVKNSTFKFFIFFYFFSERLGDFGMFLFYLEFKLEDII